MSIFNNETSAEQQPFDFNNIINTIDNATPGEVNELLKNKASLTSLGMAIDQFITALDAYLNNPTAKPASRTLRDIIKTMSRWDKSDEVLHNGLDRGYLLRPRLTPFLIYFETDDILIPASITPN